jgi:hypothetical protein
MGVNKRRISENMIKNCLSKQQSLKKLFNVDIIILTDTFSSNVYNWYCDGLSIDEIKNKIIENNER